MKRPKQPWRTKAAQVVTKRAKRPFIGIERELEYLTVSDARIAATWREVQSCEA
jgi:DNA modification methylase